MVTSFIGSYDRVSEAMESGKGFTCLTERGVSFRDLKVCENILFAMVTPSSFDRLIRTAKARGIDPHKHQIVQVCGNYAYYYRFDWEGVFFVFCGAG